MGVWKEVSSDDDEEDSIFVSYDVKFAVLDDSQSLVFSLQGAGGAQ